MDPEARQRLERLQRQQVAVDEGHHEVLLAQDAVGDVVRGELVLVRVRVRARVRVRVRVMARVGVGVRVRVGVGVRVSGELVLDDAQARGLLQVDDALHDRVPLDGLQVGVADVLLKVRVRVRVRVRVSVRVRVRRVRVRGRGRVLTSLSLKRACISSSGRRSLKKCATDQLT